MGIGLTEGLLIAAIALLFFGAKKIPQLGRTFGESIKGFKEGMKHDPNAPKVDANAEKKPDSDDNKKS